MRFSAHTAWSGSTALGWEHYDRSHAASAEPAKQELTVTGDASEERVLKLCEQAHRHCNIAKSLSCPVELEPRVAYRSHPK